MGVRAAMAVVAGCLAIPVAASADEWPSASVTEVFSQSREWFVRVVPGASVGNAIGFGGAPKGRFARAEWYRRDRDRSYRFLQETTLANPVAPVKFLVTDRGYLVTLDNWHNIGYGSAVVSYGPDGHRIAGYEPKDLFSTEEIREFRTSVSSIWWRTENVYVNSDQRSVYIPINGEGESFIYEPETGRWQYCNHTGQQYRCRSTNENRAWGSFREP